MVVTERTTHFGKPQTGQEHRTVNQRARKRRTEQLKPRQPELAIDQQIHELGVEGDCRQRDPQDRLRPVDRAHEITDGLQP